MSKVNVNRAKFCIFRALAILFLPFLMIAGLVLAYMGFIQIPVESHTVVIVGVIFITFIFFVKHNANYAACHMKGTMTNLEEALQDALRANALTIMDKTKSTLNVREFIADYYQDVRSDQFAQVAPSVFPMMGILGTFTAIAMSMPDFSVEDVEALDRDISLLLAGIGTAFYASIYGIFLSLLWTYFEKKGSLKVDHNVHELEKIYGSRVWKESELIKHQHMQSALKDQEIVQTLKETFHMEFVRELNEQYLVNFTTIVNHTNTSFSQLTEQMRNASIELSNTLDKIHQREDGLTAITSLENHIKGFNESTHYLGETLETFDGSVNRTFGKIDTELGQAIEKLTAFVGIINEQNRWMMSEIEKLKQGR